MHAQSYFSDRSTLPKHFEITILESSPLITLQSNNIEIPNFDQYL